MRTSVNGGKNEWFDRICLSSVLPIDENGTTIEKYASLVQDKCPRACVNLECMSESSC